MANDNITTIKLNKKTKQRLEKLRIHKRDSYEEIVQRMLSILNLSRTNPDKAQDKLQEIERQIKLNKN
jgi:hypothetical protein